MSNLKEFECSNCGYRTQSHSNYPSCLECGAVLMGMSPSPLDTQVGGNHYKNFKIQPFEFFHANQLPFHKADIVKRIMRYDLPTGKGKQDLEKIIHEVQMIMELEGY
jgi:hypothetical protein